MRKYKNQAILGGGEEIERYFKIKEAASNVKHIISSKNCD